MNFSVNDRVFYPQTGEYGVVTEIDPNFVKPIIAQRDGKGFDMCYYEDGRLYSYEEIPTIVKVVGNEKEIEKYKIKIKLRKLEDSIIEIKRLIKKVEDCPLVIKYLENTKNIIDEEISKLSKDIDK